MHIKFIGPLNCLGGGGGAITYFVSSLYYIDVCEKYAKEFNIKFNRSKSRLLLFKGRNCKISTRVVTVNMVNGVSLTLSETAVHPGHDMSTKDKECTVNAAKNSFWRSFNRFISDLWSFFWIIIFALITY